jgi:hypothetical protein
LPPALIALLTAALETAICSVGAEVLAQPAMNRTATAATPILCIIGFDLGSLVFSIIFILNVKHRTSKAVVATTVWRNRNSYLS